MKTYKLGEVCEVVSGTTPKTSLPEYWDGDIDWITPAELSDETYIINESVRKITQQAVSGTGLNPFPAGTVILSSRAPIGKVAIAGKEMYCNQGFKNLICSEKISNVYLYWFLKGNTQYLNSLGRGATFKEISKSIVESIEIVLPSMDEQLKRAETLKKCWDIINLRKQELKRLDNLVKARFVEMFGDPINNPKDWKEKLLSEVCTKITDGEHQNPVFVESGIPMIMANNVREGVTKEGCRYITEQDYQKFSKKCAPEFGDILLVSRGATIGRCCENNLDEPFSLMGSVILIKNKKDIIESKFLLNWLRNKKINQLIYTTSSASAQQAIYMKDLAQTRIVVPPMDMQQSFVAFVTQVDKSKVVVQKALDESQTLFDSLIQQYFG